METPANAYPSRFERVYRPGVVGVQGVIEARGGDLDAVVGAIASEIETRVGVDPVTGRMLAHVVTATSPR